MPVYCPICITEKENKDCIKVSCNHEFCEECWLIWHKDNTICPICRSNVTSWEKIPISNTHNTLDKNLSEYREWITKANLDEKKHQLTGIEWCLKKEINPTFKFSGKPGGIIADEM